MNDDCIKYKLNVLYKIADLLNKEHISWAVGASLLLYLKGIVHEFNDIDIMVTESDVFRLKEILLSLGSLKSSKINSKYKTKYFFEFNNLSFSFNTLIVQESLFSEKFFHS